MKRHLTRQEEFDILKIVIDKFLLLGVFLLALGVYQLVNSSDNFVVGMSILLGGVFLLVILSAVLIREYEFIKK